MSNEHDGKTIEFEGGQFYIDRDGDWVREDKSSQCHVVANDMSDDRFISHLLTRAETADDVYNVFKDDWFKKDTPA